MLQLTGNRPLPGVLYGITHTLEGAPIVREARVLKVGIGVPKGKGLYAWIHSDGLWYLRITQIVEGKPKEITTPKGYKTRAEAEAVYRENYPKAAIHPNPRKLGYFTFTKPVLQKDGSEVFEPDFDAIEAHGPTPTEIDIVFLDDNPFDGAYQMWSASQMECKGDGVVAQRVVELGLKGTPEEQALAKQAKERGEKYFPIINACWTNGCRFSKEFEKNGKLQPSPCKPGGDLKFQLASNIRVGGTAYFHSTGYRSISQIFSSLERIKALTGGRLAGIPLKMVLRPYRTRHNEQTATQYGVSLEFRAEDIQAVRKNLIEQAWKFRELAAPTAQRRYLDTPATEQVIEDDDDDPPITAKAMANEFYANRSVEDDFGDPNAPTAPPPSTAEAATNARTADLAEKLAKKQRKKEEPAPAEAAAPEPPPAQQSAATAPVEEAKTEDPDWTKPENQMGAATTNVDEGDFREDPPEDPEDDRFKKKEGDLF